jgi:V8-like Glu-specific endopeptidase
LDWVDELWPDGQRFATLSQFLDDCVKVFRGGDLHEEVTFMSRQVKSSKSRSKSSAPLSESELATTRFKIRTHAVVLTGDRIESFDVSSIDGREPPNVKTSIVQLAAKNGGKLWQVQVAISGRTVRDTEPPPVKTVTFRKKSSAFVRLTPSIPDDGSRVAVKPKNLLDSGLRAGPLKKGRLRPLTIFNPDDRRSFYDERYPWRCLCKVRTPKGSGSGVLVGPRHVLTASHVIDWTPGWVNIKVLLNGTNFLANASATHVYASVHIQDAANISYSDADEDYAVLVLNQRLGDQFGWMGTRSYNSKWDEEQQSWRNMGYPGDRGWMGTTPIYQRNFLLNELGADSGSARLVRSQTIDGFKGQSGGPIFNFWTDGPYVVGVFSAEDDDYNYISSGSLLPSMVQKARGDFP